MIRIGFVRRTILSRIGSSPWAPLWALLAIMGPAGLRLALNPFVTGLPFLTFFPALLAATVALGWRWGWVVLVGSALAANYMFQPPQMSFAFGAQEIIATACFVIFGALQVSAAQALRRSVLELEERNQREADLNLELQHRVNNNLTVIQGLARQTARNTKAPEDFYETFSERLLAVSKANQILSRQGWEIVVMPELAEAALKPFKVKGDLHIEGDPCRLPASSCVPLVLALHELATNAVKYGSLSVSSGCVRVRWSVENGQCQVTWREEGGPVVIPPTRRGLGSRLLRAQTGLETVQLDFPPEGVLCRVVIDGAEKIDPKSVLLKTV
ncbi:MAG TPA: HWE histidine kinase domain-containing protein [Caulobacter sp.]|nr:HWE histidine kinase domain-containing protein [Caulobacter sp.]